MNKDVLAYRLKVSFSRFGERPAIRVGSRSWTYAELRSAALAVSGSIMQKLPHDSNPVAILAERSFEACAGICGALLASRAFMPLNLKFPAGRNRVMLQRSGARAMVLDKKGKIAAAGIITEAAVPVETIDMMDLPGGNDMQFPELTSAPGDTAYLLFTSGTTGTPKGVPVSNANVCAYLDHVLQTWDFNERDRFSQTFDLTFDLSVHDLMVCWLSGACLCIPEEDSPLRMAEYIRQQQISVWFSVPSAAVLMNRMRLLRRDAFPELRLSFFCGEPLPETIADKWLEACGGRELVNLYGPTEATIAISSYTWNEQNKKSRNGIVSIGKIFSNQHCMLLDAENMMPAEKEGELCLAGSQVIRAYLHDPGRTEKQFVRIQGHPGKKWYRTGDRVSVDGEGELFYLGRTDNEVKISGYRVNLLEVDAVLAKITGSGQVASVLTEKPAPAIVSFIGAGEGAGQQDIIRACREVLPWYMIPERIIFVDEMPLNVNGKIDRGRLKQMVDE